MKRVVIQSDHIEEILKCKWMEDKKIKEKVDIDDDMIFVVFDKQ